MSKEIVSTLPMLERGAYLLPTACTSSNSRRVSMAIAEGPPPTALIP
jgi:hypothetical protein